MQWDTIPAVLAHELRNPLAGVVVHLDLMREMMDPDDPRMTNLEAMDTEVTRMENTIGAILDFARQGKIKRNQVGAGTMLQSMGDRARLEATRRGVTLEIEMSSFPGEISVDQILLGRALENIVDNACKAVAGQAGGKVVLRGKYDGVNLVLTCTDNGGGISAENQEKIFEPFFTRSTRGVGLGLALAQRVVTDHGGELQVRSTLGQGSEFIIRIPRHATVSGPTEEIVHDAVAAR